MFHGTHKIGYLPSFIPPIEILWAAEANAQGVALPLNNKDGGNPLL